MSKRTKKTRWRIIPSAKPEDQLYNRRLLSYFSLFYSAIWFQEVLIVILVSVVLGKTLDAGVVTALVGVPTALAGLGFWKYLEAAKKHDASEGKDDARETESQPPEPVQTPKV